jgi:uncharacterized protein (DUF983 family)
MEKPRRSAFAALLAQRCPRCRDGRVFASAIRMNDACPACGLVFTREEGYFIGAMYVSYGLSSLVLILGMLVVHLFLPELDLGWAILIALVAYLPFVPLAFRYSRMIWMYFDRWVWPDEKAEGSSDAATPRSAR